MLSYQQMNIGGQRQFGRIMNSQEITNVQHGQFLNIVISLMIIFQQLTNERPAFGSPSHIDGFLFSWHPNGGEVSSEPRRAMNVNSFAGDRKNSKLWRGGGLDLGRWPEVTGNLPQCHILYKSWSKYFLTKNFYWLWKPAILHIPDVKMHVDYGPGIRLAEKISKTPQIGFLFHILSFITLKPEVFPITSGHRPRSRPPPRHNVEFFLSPEKEFTLIGYES